MKLKRILIVLSALLLLLSGCTKTPETALPPEVTIHTSSTATTVPDTEPASPTSETQPPVVTLPEEQTTLSEALAEPEVTESDATEEETPEPQAPEVDEPIDFSFPEEFYLRLDEILLKYSVNSECEPLEDGGCTCAPEFEELDEEGNVITPRQRVLSLYYCDLESGWELFINPDPHYPVASTVKIPFVVYLYQKIDLGEIDPELMLTYEKRHYFHGTGVIVESEFGTQYSVKELLDLAITRSDNVAYEMLKDLVPWEEFQEYLVEIGCSHSKDRTKIKQKICLESAAAYAKVLEDYLVCDSPYVGVFRENLLITKNKMIRSHYTVLRKYGWTNFAFHDIAYIEAPHPYLLCILSNIDSGEREEYSLFADLSYLIEEYANMPRDEELAVEDDKIP